MNAIISEFTVFIVVQLQAHVMYNVCLYNLRDLALGATFCFLHGHGTVDIKLCLKVTARAKSNQD